MDLNLLKEHPALERVDLRDNPLKGEVYTNLGQIESKTILLSPVGRPEEWEIIPT